MSNSFENTTSQVTKIKQNLTQASEIAKKLPDKLNQLLKTNSRLEQQKKEILQENEDLKGQVAKLEADLLAQEADFDQKLKTSENKFVSLQRELEIAKDDLKDKAAEIVAKEERIKILESQNKELKENLQQKSE